MNLNSLARISKVVQTEATTTSIGDFLLTHVPFENLYLDAENKKSISELNLLNDVLLKNHDEHKFIMIQGGNGSGKSHLIRWLKEKYTTSVSSEKEAVLLISRAHNTLQDALGQLLESDIFPEEIKENELKHIKNAKSNITGEELNKTINFNFTLEIDSDEDKSNSLLDLRTRRWLSTYLSDKYIQSEFLLNENGPIERIRGKIEHTDNDAVNLSDDPMFKADDFNISVQQIRSHLQAADSRAAEHTIRLAEEFNSTRKGAELRLKVANYLNSKVSNVIQRSMKLQTADFKKLFASLRKTLKSQGIGLTLFVEDINSFTGIDEALMEVLLTDHNAQGNEDYCRIISVVGSTSYFYNSKLNASIKERIKTNIYISESSILPTQTHVNKFAARYINAINIPKEEVDEWVKEGADDINIPIAKCEWEWANVNCDDNILSIFPFNENAIWNLYKELPNEKRTPRVLLKSIIGHILKIWYTTPERLFLDESNFLNADVVNLPRWSSALFNRTNIEIDEESATSRSILLRVWGDKTANSNQGLLGGLTTDVFKAFDIFNNISGDAPKIITKHDTKTLDIKQSSQAVSSQSISAPVVSVPTVSEQKHSKPVEYVTEPVIKKPQKLIDIEKDLENWMYGTDKTSTRLASQIELRELLIDFLKVSIEWEVEEVPKILADTYLNKNWFHIEGTNKETVGFVLNRSDESYYLLIALANFRYLGDRTWNFEGSADHLINAISWLEQNKKKVIESIIAPPDKAEVWNLPLWSIAASYGIKTLFGGIDVTKSSEEIVVELLSKTPDFNEATEHSESWENLKKIVLKSDNYKNEILKTTIAYFSKSTGSAIAGSTPYTFIDAYEVLRLVRKMKTLQWSVDELVPTDIEKYKGVWYYSANFLNEFSHKVAIALTEEKEKAREYLNLFELSLDNNFSEESVTLSINSMKDFLKFLLNNLNLSYNEEDYKIIKPSSSPSKLIASLNRISKVLEDAKPFELLLRISKNPFDDIEKFKHCFIMFNRMLDEKYNLFEGHIDLESKAAITEYKATIVSDLETISNESTRLCSIGGTANET